MRSTRLSRRSFVAAVGIGGAMLAAGCRRGVVSRRSPTPEPALPRGVVPLDDGPHERTWMAWPSSAAIWGPLLNGAQRDIAGIASAIARFEPVTMLATDAAAASAARAACGNAVDVIDTIPVDDCWARDSGPIFRTRADGRPDAIGLNFNGWGGEQRHEKDGLMAERVAADAGVPFSRAAVTGEGGAIETDGDGTVMATESSLVNPERNPGMSKADVEAAVLAAYGASAMIWVPGLRDRDITDDHIDATSRFVRPGVVMVQRPPSARTDVWAEDARAQLAILSKTRDARGRAIRVIEVDGPRRVRSSDPDFVDSYVNYYVCNGGVVMAQFGDDERDEVARAALAGAFPGRTVVQLNCDALAEGGGGIHCVTQQQPRS